MIINPYLVQPSGPSYGTLTTAWIAATGETDLTILGALNTLETDLTTYGLTAKMKALYPFVGGTSTKHSYNFVNTAAYQLSFVGGWTHSSNGALPNGTNAYADTGIKRNVMAANSAAFGVYIRNNNNDLRADIGVTDANWNTLVSGVIYSAINSSNPRLLGATATSVGFTHASLTSASSFHRVYRNGALFATDNEASSGTNGTTLNFYIAAQNNGGSAIWYSNKQLALTFLSDGLNATEAANFYTAVQTYQTALSRNV
jgi:hypothetical protein